MVSFSKPRSQAIEISGEAEELLQLKFNLKILPITHTRDNTH